MKVSQEPKYDTVDGRLVNRATGVAIPDDEPVFIFRARDIHSVPALKCYAAFVDDHLHQKVIRQRIRDFLRFEERNPLRMKEPDTDASVLDA